MSKIKLNEDQSAAFEHLKKFIDSTKSNMCLLEGAAGTGKTTTISKFIEWVVDHSIFQNICMSSPTHKALKVMTDMCPSSHKSDVTFCTLHSLLGMKREITKDGKEVFVRDKKIIPKFSTFDLVIVDESSMIDNQLFLEMQEQNYRNIKVLFVGDSNQINPVNHSMSIPMTPEKRVEYKIGHCRLTKIVRQAEDNPIIKYSQQVINDTFEFSPGEKDMNNDCGVVMVGESQTKVVSQLIDFYFNSEKFDKDADYCKIIAWRNVTVDYYNKYVRSFKYGKNAPKIVVNEKLIIDRPVMGSDRKSTIFNTNEDIVVNTLEINTKNLWKEEWTYYKCCVSNGDKVEDIHILHESEEARYQKYLKKLSKEALAEKDISKRLSKWKDYFSFMENFAQVKYNYAITCHCAQGSTYENCFVVSNDISLNRRDDESKRIMYTAFTRPKKMLYIL